MRDSERNLLHRLLVGSTTHTVTPSKTLLTGSLTLFSRSKVLIMFTSQAPSKVYPAEVVHAAGGVPSAAPPASTPSSKTKYYWGFGILIAGLITLAVAAPVCLIRGCPPKDSAAGGSSTVMAGRTKPLIVSHQPLSLINRWQTLVIWTND